MNFVKIFILFICFYSQIFAQQVTLYRVNVEGNTTTSDKMIKYSAGLRDGTQIQRSDISTAITRLWDLGLFGKISFAALMSTCLVEVSTSASHKCTYAFDLSIFLYHHWITFISLLC